MDVKRWLMALAVAALLITPIGSSATALAADRGPALAVPSSHNDQPPDERQEQQGDSEGQPDGDHEPGADQRTADHDEDDDYDEDDDGSELGWIISAILSALHLDELID